jgi:hypothetical protein
MTSKKKNLTSTDQNYKLNMEILSSLKSIPGKVVNLQSENFINEELNKKLQYPEGKKTTSSSISKVSKDFFCDQLEEKNTNKKLMTTNSVFKPMVNLPQKKSTMNFYPFNTVMSFPDLCIQNPIANAPPKITNSSFSRNSFCVMNPNLDPNLSLLNQMNTLTQINQINPINQYNFFSQNPFNSFGTLNALNTPTIPLNDIYLNKNNNSNNIKNIFLGQKRNSDEKTEEKEKEKIFNNKKNIFFQINPQKKENSLNLNNNSTNNIINTNSQETTNKRNLFTVIPKSTYNYKKRKPRKRKALTGIKKKLTCSHHGCEGTFKTKKQLLYHHYKMNPQCQNDTIAILKMIYNIKILLKNNNLEKNKKKFGELYKQTMKNVSLDEHIETLVGYNFEDEINEKIE